MTEHQSWIESDPGDTLLTGRRIAERWRMSADLVQQRISRENWLLSRSVHRSRISKNPMSRSWNARVASTSDTSAP